MILGITGIFGSGKTTVSNMFRKHGFEIINADKLYHGIYNKNKALRNKIKKEFGTLDRNEIKKIVFNDSQKLQKLNKITHPIIINSIKKEINKIKQYNKEAEIIVDVPLLFEAKMQNMFDKIIVVKCNEKAQIKRLLKKGKHLEEEIKHIIKSQMPIEEKIEYADFVVDNSKTLEKTKNRIEAIIKNIA